MGENYDIFENYMINVDVAKVVGYLVRVFRSFSAEANTMSITCVKQFKHLAQAAFGGFVLQIFFFMFLPSCCVLLQ